MRYSLLVIGVLKSTVSTCGQVKQWISAWWNESREGPDERILEMMRWCDEGAERGEERRDMSNGFK
jgi:hypothetical protein